MEIESDWSSIINFKTKSTIQQEMIQNLEDKKKNQWIAGIVTGISLIVICIIIFILVRYTVSYSI